MQRRLLVEEFGEKRVQEMEEKGAKRALIFLAVFFAAIGLLEICRAFT